MDAANGDGADSGAAASRALVPTARPAGRVRDRAERPDAALIAHLIASRERVGEMRTRRRAAPGAASAAYRDADALAERLRISAGISRTL